MLKSINLHSSFILTRRRFLLALAGLLALLAALLILSPAERQLGNLVKVIYLHGALARTGMWGLMAAGALAGLFLLRLGPAFLRWSNAVQIVSMAIFVSNFLLSIIPTYVTWGVLVAFDEPRTVMTLQIIGVGLIVIIVRYLLGEDLLSALANLLLGVAVALLGGSTGVLRHPLDPIGGSNSVAIRGYYAGILLTCVLLIALLSWAVAQRMEQVEQARN